MFKSLIKKLEDENALNSITTNGSALRDTLRDAGQAVMKQVKEKVNEAQSSFNSPSNSSSSNSLANINPSPSTASIGAPSPKVGALIDLSSNVNSTVSTESYEEQFTLLRKDRDALVLRNSQLCNLIEELKRELRDERDVRKTMEREYKQPNEEIAFKVLIAKDVQTDDIKEEPSSNDQNSALISSSIEKCTVDCSCQTDSTLESEVDIEQVKNDRKQLDELRLRNAELSHTIEMVKQQLKEESNERMDLQNEMDSLLKYKLTLEEGNAKLLSQLEDERQQKQSSNLTIPLSEHQQALSKLEEQLADKNKTIKLQQQRIIDIKKSIQRGDLPYTPNSLSGSTATGNQLHGNHGYWSDDSSTDGLAGMGHNAINSKGANSTTAPSDVNRSKSPPAIIDVTAAPAAEADSTPTAPATSLANYDSSHHLHIVNTLDTNFEYLKNVIFKFLTCKDYESQKHVVKAISVLLKFNPQEEEAVKDILEWKASWYSALPIVGSLTAHHGSSGKTSSLNAPNVNARRGS